MAPNSTTPRKEVASASTARPPFQTRRTMADLVRDRMAAKKRTNCYHRIVILTEHKNFNNEFIPNLKEEFKRIGDTSNDTILNEKITGLVFYYSQYSAIMLAGPEDCLSNFVIELNKIKDKYFQKALVILFVKHINHLYFNEILWKTGDPPTILEAFSDMAIENFKKHHNSLIKQLINLWAQIHQDLESGELTTTKDWLTTRYAPNMLILSRIEIVLGSKGFYTLSEVEQMINSLPPISNYDEKIWPIPDDFIPKNIIGLGPFDVNLLFPNWQAI